MADPVSIGLLAASTIATGAGALTSASGAEYEGEARSRAANYQAAIAKINADIANKASLRDLASGQVQAEQVGMRTGQQVSAQRTGYAAGNITGPTEERVVSSEAEAGAQTQGIIQSNAAERAYGEQVTAMQDTAQSQLFTAEAGTDITTGQIGAESSLISGVGSVASKWLQAYPAFGGGTKGTNPTNPVGDQNLGT